MQRTIKEVLNLLKEKKSNAEIDLEKTFATNKVFPYPEKIYRLQGEIGAYHDAIILIETSHLVEDTKDESNKNSD